MVQPKLARNTVVIYNKDNVPLFEIGGVIKIVVSDNYTVVHVRDENGETRKFSTNLPFVYYE